MRGSDAELVAVHLPLALGAGTDVQLIRKRPGDADLVSARDFAHRRYFRTSGANSSRRSAGTCAGSVIIANRSAFAQAQSRVRAATRGMASRSTRWAIAAFARR